MPDKVCDELHIHSQTSKVQQLNLGNENIIKPDIF